MGIVESTEQRILRQPQQGEASEFYWACRDGNVERVKQLLPTIPYEKLNDLEFNGSTPLHAASFYGHSEVVRLLLHERGCRRDRLNLHGLTAYEEAQNEEIRRLFLRPGGRNRFCDDNSTENIFQVSVNQDTKQQNLSKKNFTGDQWMIGYDPSRCTAQDQRESTYRLKILFRFKIAAIIIKLFESGVRETRLIERLNTFLIEHLSDKHPQFEKSKELVRKAFKEQKPEHLLRLYTLNTPFYRALVDYGDPLFFPLIFKLEKLVSRHFQGRSYRGLLMTDEDLRAYRWSLKYKGAIETRTFCSTSCDRTVAEAFADPINVCDGKRSVLMIVNFPEKCDTAINLDRLSEDLPCISEFPGEAEVLLLPCTLFTVTKIDETTNPMIIHLEHIFKKEKLWIEFILEHRSFFWFLLFSFFFVIVIVVCMPSCLHSNQIELSN